MVHWLLFQCSLLCFAHHCLLIITGLLLEVLLAHKLKTTLHGGGQGGLRLHMGTGVRAGSEASTSSAWKV